MDLGFKIKVGFVVGLLPLVIKERDCIEVLQVWATKLVLCHDFVITWGWRALFACVPFVFRLLRVIQCNDPTSWVPFI